MLLQGSSSVSKVNLKEDRFSGEVVLQKPISFSKELQSSA
jgi:hypothetical protein